MNIANEVVVFFAFILSGMVGGIFFDLSRAFRKNFETANEKLYNGDYEDKFESLEYENCSERDSDYEITEVE